MTIVEALDQQLARRSGVMLVDQSEACALDSAVQEFPGRQRPASAR